MRERGHELVKISVISALTEVRANGGLPRSVAVRDTDQLGVYGSLVLGPWLLPGVRSLLEENFQASRESFASDTLVCTMPLGRIKPFEDWLIASLRRFMCERQYFTSDVSMWDATGALHTVLTRPYYSGTGALLSSAEVQQLELRTIDCIRQKRLVSTADHCYRYVRRMRLVGPAQVLSKLFSSDVFLLLKPTELETTAGGRCRGRTHQGQVLEDTVGVDGKGLLYGFH